MRSSPMPVSIDGFGRPDALAGADLLELHEDEIPNLDEAVAVLVRAIPAALRGCAHGMVEGILEHGPQGPVSPICQKLSEVAMRMILLSGSPAILRQRSKASSSSEKTVTRSFSGGQAEFLRDRVKGELDRERA